MVKKYKKCNPLANLTTLILIYIFQYKPNLSDENTLTTTDNDQTDQFGNTNLIPDCKFHFFVEFNHTKKVQLYILYEHKKSFICHPGNFTTWLH